MPLTESTAMGLGATSRSGVVLAVHRAALRTSATPLRRLWAALYAGAAWVFARWLVHGVGGSAYVRGSAGAGEVLPGLSDIDVAVLVGDRRAAARVDARWRRLAKAVPFAQLLFDRPEIVERRRLGGLSGSTALTFGGCAYLGPEATSDDPRMLERPGLEDQTASWRRLAGPERRPPVAPRDADTRRLAAWLELVWWWRWAAVACAAPQRPRVAAQCVKLVAEPARVWLAVTGRDARGDRAAVLRRALAALPEEEPALRAALELQAALPRSPQPPLDLAVGFLARTTARVAAWLAEDVASCGTTAVALVGATTDAGGTLPLADWRAVVCPAALDERFVAVPGDPGDPGALGASALSVSEGAYPALHRGDLLVLASVPVLRSRMRAVQCPVAEPVPFALLRGERVAHVADVPGWSIADTARRAVTEHAGWLRGPAPAPWRAVGAARALLLDESIGRGEPELLLTAGAVRERLGFDPSVADIRALYASARIR